MIKKITDRIFPALIALSAFSVSASAAFYSISGLSKLFAGAAFAVIVMAASLEVAKLVIASLLYQYRKTLPFLLKAYLSIACVVLILITSMGIYGFLSAAYQDTANKEGNAEARIVLIETKRDNVKEQLEVYTEEKTSINEAVAELRKGLSNNKVQWRDKETGQIITSTSSRTRKALEKQLDQAIIRQTEINSKVDILNEKIFKYETEIVETRIGDGSTSELGPLKYLSGLTGLPMDKIINYLLLTIIFVFDPLAIALVIAANFAFEKLKKPTKENLYGETIEIDEDEANRRMRVISQNGNDGLHYRDEIESEPAEEFDDDSKTISDTEAQIQTLKKQIDKINLQDNTGKKASIAIDNITKQIEKLRDEDNIITY
jgi:predicted  nucleic acid-binding Zn-ribbon protein